jgi:phage shock protein A
MTITQELMKAMEEKAVAAEVELASLLRERDQVTMRFDELRRLIPPAGERARKLRQGYTVLAEEVLR